jgi:argininosuccinate lyase
MGVLASGALVREVGLPFRLAHKIVATTVQNAVRNGVTSLQLTVDQLQAAAREILGSKLDFTATQFVRALNPQHFVNARCVPSALIDLTPVD